MKLRVLSLLVCSLAFAFAGCSSGEKEEVDAGQIIIGHVTDSHIWHICDYNSKSGKHTVAVNLPIILVDNGKLDIFSSKQFHHGHAVYSGKNSSYALIGGGASKEEIIRVKQIDVATDDGNVASTQPVGYDAENDIFVDHEGKSYAVLHDEDGSLSKPVDLSLTKISMSIIFAVVILFAIVFGVGRQYKKRKGMAPHGFQSLIEMLVLHVRDGIVAPILKKNTDRFLPYLLTLFFFIILCNVMGLIPFFPAGVTVTGNLAVTGILALITFVITNVCGNKHYWKDIFNTPGVPAWLKIFPLMPVIEFTGIFIKPFVLMIRLFANMTGGHIILLGFVVFVLSLSNSMGLAAGGVASVVSVLFSVFIYALELLVAYIQAFVFTMLTTLYISMAIEEPEEA